MLKLQGAELRRLFNTSGLEYRKLNLKERLSEMAPKEALTLLSQNGMLIKRPILLSKEVALLGFKEEQWKHNLIND